MFPECFSVQQLFCSIFASSCSELCTKLFKMPLCQLFVRNKELFSCTRISPQDCLRRGHLQSRKPTEKGLDTLWGPECIYICINTKITDTDLNMSKKERLNICWNHWSQSFCHICIKAVLSFISFTLNVSISSLLIISHNCMKCDILHSVSSHFTLHTSCQQQEGKSGVK